MRATARTAICAGLVAMCWGGLMAQQAPPAGQAAGEGRGGRGGRQAGPPQYYWVQKTKGGVFVPPNKPITRLADLKAKHKGQATWKETVVRDLEIQADYHSSAQGTKILPQFHPGTNSFVVVFEGEMRWEIEDQQPFLAKRGSIVYIPSWTIFSFEVAGTAPALFVEVNPAHFDTVFPGNLPAPPALPGAAVTKVTFNRTPSPYSPPHVPHWNLHDSVAAGLGAGVRIRAEHMYANANYGFADPNDPLNPNRGRGGAVEGRGGRGAGAPGGPFDPKVPFGHLHAGSAEWWMVMVGHISGQFESGEVIGSEGDILYAPPYTWHQMGNRGPGPSCRLAIGAYDPVNFGNVPAQ